MLENGIKKRGGDELGKTIIFAKNRKHAQFLKDTFMDLDKEQFRLVQFIISLIGLSPEKLDAAFAIFINDYKLNAVQIEFLDTIKKILTS